MLDMHLSRLRTSLRMARGKWHIPQLDGLRGIAVLLVVMYHAWPSLNVAGREGVTIFFVLSGYLITSIALKEEAERGKVSLVGFYIRRTFRIFPLYYLTLGSICLLILGFGLQPQKRAGLSANLGYYVLYLQEYAFTFRGGFDKLPFGQSWTLGIEEKFYLVWPILAFWILANRPRTRLGLAVVLLVIFAIFGGLNEACWYTIFNYSSILIGCVLALCSHQFRPSSQWGRFRFTYPALGLLIALQLGVAPHASAPAIKALVDTCYALVVACVLWAVVYEQTVVSNVIGAGAMALIGRVSYGIYLTHVVVLNFARKITQEPSLLFVLTAVLSICLASLLYKLIESPLIAIGRRLSHQTLQQTRSGVALIPDAAVRTP